MKAASLNELQKELTTLEPKRVLKYCVRLMKYKKENKELLTYLLFESHDEESFIKKIKEEMDMQFSEMKHLSIYLEKKSIRKILRMINKYIRYSGIKETEIELRIYYCIKLKKSGIPIHNSKLLTNLYNNQLAKIKTTLAKLHEDLQYEYVSRLNEL
ncbi:MAG TPA: hypothetical protein VI757_03665 [Bacteroidia bacterium]|nr:hypothetical protein [Bacteroidia bacterium]